MTHEDTEGSITNTHTAAFSDPYEWWHMQDEYYVWGIEPEEAVNAVSELMFELGVAAKMDYENGASTASSEILGSEIQKHFFYEPLTHTESSDFDQLMNSVLNGLADRRPCIASIPGHSLVIDGHMKQEEDNYFHINYGYSGQNDGWYLLDNVREEVITDVFTGIRPTLTALHLGSEYTTNGIELRWVLPRTRSEEATRIDVLKQNILSGTWKDEAEQFGTFEVTSTSDYKDWSLSSTGNAGSCFYKPAGGYGNREYHLTSNSSFRPGQETMLTFKAKYFLSEDGFRVLISSDNGSSFSPVWSVSDTAREHWTEIQIPLEAFSGRDILIRFEYLTGEYYPDGGIWIDEVRLINVTGADYLKYPVYYTTLADLTEGINILAYQVRAGEQIHPRSEAFIIDVSRPTALSK